MPFDEQGNKFKFINLNNIYYKKLIILVTYVKMQKNKVY